MNKTAIVVILATLLIIVGGVFLVSRNSGGGNQEPLPPPTSYEYYWGDGCPHCKIVEDFLKTWDKKDKVQITKYEVWNSAENAKRLEQRAITCGIKPQDMGVPLLFSPDGKCLDGDTQIIDYLKNLQ